ncbi:LLM class flavin-dependent oxidoreductase [Frankia sp. AgKG'84/4]|uniref:LLM class flavin-dependent oxidoreductase n=1 Tax=Frankia sp. AgKG'84/4 TaxID=573490 RepID=UPI0020105900|nr:LLM class flavin-dependent oxidoreductase [Frankia sp. AgKG'84/4]MCL9794846.1 LLM class flavin-dependent oxidoreductase [Frankia sp. AgKG'84/4]
MDIFSFHLMPWPYLPADYGGSAWITVPNGLYDPGRGHDLYNRYLDELEYAEQVGFDGLVVNEHHQTAYGSMPSPNLFAALLARRTSRAKIAVIGNALPLYNPPTRVAEEFAVLDVVTGGRLIAGMVVGGGPEYYSSGVNPAQARRRFAEALDLVVQAWTRPGPFEFDGEFYKIPHVNPWPRPLQQPHPPVWIPGLGSLETMELVAARGFSYVGLPFFHSSVFERNYAAFRQIWLAAGRDPAPENLGLLLPIYVAESDAAARAEYEEHLWYFARKLLNGVQIVPPGYQSVQSAVRLMENASKYLLGVSDWETVVSGSYAIVGSPDTVAEKLADLIRRLGVGNLLGLFQLGSLPAHLTRANLTLFAEQVMPKLRAEFATPPVWPETLV